MDTSSFGQLMRYLALAPYLCEKTEECARAAYKIRICIGEDVPFETLFTPFLFSVVVYPPYLPDPLVYKIGNSYLPRAVGTIPKYLIDG